MPLNHSVSIKQARRFLLLRHGLLGQTSFRGKQGVLDFIRMTGCLQFDPIDICGKSPELSLYSRVEGFSKETLGELLYQDRQLIDFFDKNLSIMLVEDWPYLERFRQKYRDRSRSSQEVDVAADIIRQELRLKGPLSSAEIGHKGSVDWYWSRSSLARAVLETLYFRGELVIHSKKGTVKTYDFAENHLPKSLLEQEDPYPLDEDHYAWRVLRRIGAVGLLWPKASDAWLGIEKLKAAERVKAFERLQEEGTIREVWVEGSPEPFYYRSEEEKLWEKTMGPIEGSTRFRFLAPLDAMLWDRKLIQRFFDFSYTWEIYKPREQREFGYYVLPMLYGDRIVGRIEPVCRRKEGLMHIQNLWWEKGVEPSLEMVQDLQRDLQAFAKWNGCELDWKGSLEAHDGTIRSIL